MASFNVLLALAVLVAAVSAEPPVLNRKLEKKQVYPGYFGAGFGAYPYNAPYTAGAYPSYTGYTGAYPYAAAKSYPYSANYYSASAYPYSASAYPYSASAYPYSASAYPYSAGAYSRYSGYPFGAYPSARTYY